MLSRRNALSLLATLAVILALTVQVPAAGPAGAATPVAWDDLLADWSAQDKAPADKGKECFIDQGGFDVENRMIARVLGELGAGGREMSAEMAKLVDAKVPGSDARWKNLYIKACKTRRAKRLSPLLAKCSRVVYTKHFDMGGSHYAYTEGQSDAQAERNFKAGTALCVVEVDGGLGKARTIIEDAGGVIRDPDVSYDGKRILFAWKKSDRQDDYHLYEMEAATGKTRQLTAGLGFADYEGAYLSDGNIIFNSTRCVQIVDCWWTEVSNLYICDKDGQHMRRVGFDQVHTNYPTVTYDGRVLYTRWDYNDRGQIYPQPLFQMNPDGTGQTEAYGNNSWFPTTIMHARGIPGTQKILAVLSGHHSHQRGKLALIDPSVGTQEATGVTLVAPIRETKAVRVDAYGQDGEQFQYPYPVTETQFLVAYRPQGSRNRRDGKPFGIYFMDVDGRRELLAADARISCQQPVPLASRPVPPARPSTVDYRKTTGVYYVRDVYVGPGLQGIERGTVKRLRVVSLDFRVAGIGENGSGGLGGGALASTPVSVRNGTWDVKTVLGSAPVHEDGSAMFLVPARTPVYFQLLDANGFVVQSMRSWSTLQPGETFSCVGCHEDKNAVSPAEGYVSRALQEGARPLEPFYGPARGFSFPKEIQPILDKHCIRCHNDRSAMLTALSEPRNRKGAKAPVVAKPTVAALPARPLAPGEKRAFSLLGEGNLDKGAKRYWSDSYLQLTQNGKPNKIVQWLNVQSIPPMLPPYFAGSAKSELISMLAAGHNDVKLSREEMDKLRCWIDLLVPYCGDYTEANAWSDGEKQKYAKYMAKRQQMEAMDQANIKALAGGRPSPAMPAERVEKVESKAEVRSDYRNVALNPKDVQGKAAGYPHASSNSEYGNNPVFAAKCAIDGNKSNKGHGGKFPSWGPDKRTDLWWKVELARPAAVDKIILTIRADFPHDKHWHSATVEFSDGSKEKITIQKSAEAQTFSFAKRTVTWVKFTDLAQDAPLGWCGFSEVEVWGQDVADARHVRAGERGGRLPHAFAQCHTYCRAFLHTSARRCTLLDAALRAKSLYS